MICAESLASSCAVAEVRYNICVNQRKCASCSIDVSDMGPETHPTDAADRLIALTRELLIQSRPEAAPRLKVMLESRLERDLGIDSLARVELMLRMERAFGVQLAEGVVAEAETLSDLLRAVLGASVEALPALALEVPAPATAAEGVEGSPGEARTL